MARIRSGLASSLGAAAPRGEYARARARISLDSLLTTAITIIAVALAIGYQVMIRVGPRRSSDRH